MKTTLEKSIYTLEIEHSVFIGVLLPVHDESEVSSQLLHYRKTYPKATHYCYAYRLDDKQKSNDDGEPSGTAGRPLLELLNKRDLNRVMLLVIRYYGGVKLGAGRLMRTYVDVAVKAIDQAYLVTISQAYRYTLVLSYSEYELLKMKAAVSGYTLDGVTFRDQVELSIISQTPLGDRLDNLFKRKVEFLKEGMMEVLLP